MSVPLESALETSSKSLPSAVFITKFCVARKMASPIHHSITASCRELLEDLSNQRVGKSIDPTQCPISSIISQEQLTSRIQSILGKLKEEFKLGDGANTEPDTLKGHFEVSGREVILEVAVGLDIHPFVTSPFSPGLTNLGRRVVSSFQ